MTLDLVLDEHDINLTITHLDRIPMHQPDPTNPNTLIFRTMAELKEAEGLVGQGDKAYWR